MKKLTQALAEQLYPGVTFRGVVYVCSNVLIHPGAVIGESVKLSDDVTVMRDAEIGDYSFIGRGVCIRKGGVIPADHSINPDYSKYRREKLERESSVGGAMPFIDRDGD